jgi:hypothetical protein
MTGRRLAVAAGAAAAALLLASTPASAAEPTVEWTHPKPDDRNPDDRVIRAQAPITATIAGDQGQKLVDVEFELVQQLDDPEDPCFVEVPEEQRVQSFAEKPNRVDVKFDVVFPCNRAYELEADVTYEEPVVAGVSLAAKKVKPKPSLAFKVAIPPTQVTGLKAAYDPGSREVRLTWDGNTEVDLRGYRVERNPPGRDGFRTAAELGKGETAFTDTGIDEPHRYRVFAVRSGPDGRNIEGKASTAVSAGPDAPEPTVPEVTPTTRGTTATTRGSATAGGGRPTVRKRTATTVDTGFSRDLPFDPSQTTTSQLPTTTSEPEGQAAVLAEFDDEDGDDRRATLVPIAGGLALLMSAVHVRLFSKRLEDDEIPVFPGS